MPHPAPPDRARLGLFLPAFLLLWLAPAPPCAWGEQRVPPDRLTQGASAPESLATSPPDTLAASEPDTLAHTPAPADTVPRAIAAQAPSAHPAGHPFQQIPLATNYGSSHTLSNMAIIGGIGLIGASFALGSKANSTYDAYLRETDPAQIDELYDRTVWLDRSSSGSLLLGEVLVCLGLYGRFLSHPSNAMAWRLEPGRCALSYRF